MTEPAIPTLEKSNSHPISAFEACQKNIRLYTSSKNPTCNNFTAKTQKNSDSTPNHSQIGNMQIYSDKPDETDKKEFCEEFHNSGNFFECTFGRSNHDDSKDGKLKESLNAENNEANQNLAEEVLISNRDNVINMTPILNGRNSEELEAYTSYNLYPSISDNFTITPYKAKDQEVIEERNEIPTEILHTETDSIQVIKNTFSPPIMTEERKDTIEFGDLNDGFEDKGIVLHTDLNETLKTILSESLKLESKAKKLNERKNIPPNQTVEIKIKDCKEVKDG